MLYLVIIYVYSHYNVINFISNCQHLFWYLLFDINILYEQVLKKKKVSFLKLFYTWVHIRYTYFVDNKDYIKYSSINLNNIILHNALC